MEVSAERPARVATFILMAVAYVACEIAAYPDGNVRPFGVAFGMGLFAIAVIVSYFLPGPRAGERHPPRRWVILFAIIACLPIAFEPVLRFASGNGFPLELQLVNALRIFGLTLCAASAWPVCRRTAGVVALFLALFSSAMGDQPQIPYVLVPFAVLGGVWLILAYRAEQSSARLATNEGVIQRVRLRWPYRETIAIAVLIAVAIGLAVAGPKRVLLTLGELVPTSGGSGATDPFARSGVGDGPEEAAGENASAAGMVETDRMIEDARNSLIDAVSDLYGPPHKPNREQERMVAAGMKEVIENHGTLPENRRPSRDFETARKGPKSDRKPESRGARGILEVEGRTPLHIRFVAYDRYRAEEGRWEEARKPGNRYIEALDEGEEMTLSHLRPSEWYGRDDRHRIKIADLRDNLVPTPSLLTHFRIRHVDRPDYYEWDYDGVLAFKGRKKMPPGIVVNTVCRTIDPTHLDEQAIATTGSRDLFEVPESLHEEIQRLAREWTHGVPRGGPEIEAVLSRLRAEFVLDPHATAPKDHPSPVIWFLNESRRGPDYLFATAAALMFRSLGYPARVCLGYYASPNAYDAETDHTPVTRRDLHVWPELLLRDNHWLVVEATPGYATLPRLIPWRERLSVWLRDASAWAGRHAVLLIFGSAWVGWLAWKRRHVADQFLILWATLIPGRTLRDRSFRAMAVLDRRLRLAGHSRPETATPSHWIARHADEPDLRSFARLVEWAAYAPNIAAPIAESSAESLCRAVGRDWTLARLQRVLPETTHR